MASLKETARAVIKEHISMRTGRTLLLLWKKGRSWHHEFFPRTQYDGGHICENSVVATIDYIGDKNAKLVCIANLPEAVRDSLACLENLERFLFEVYE